MLRLPSVPGNPFSALCLLSTVFFCLPSIGLAGYGFDAGQDVVTYASTLKSVEVSGRNGEWLRVRGIAGSGGEGDHSGRTEEADRAALRDLRARGVRVCVILRWGSQEWGSGVRGGGGYRMPLDLRDAYERGHRLGQTYGDLVDAWEIDNEPDIGFVHDNPETYAAFLKASYLGLHAGIVERAKSETGSLKPEAWFLTAKDAKRREDGGRRTGGSNWLDRKQGLLRSSVLGSPSSVFRTTTPRVIMAPLALPPGPYLERLWANGFASYTDGFNYHYYGFAEDFAGVHRQFRDAVRILNTEDAEFLESGLGSLSARSAASALKKKWPVFITEYGYGRLSADARNTVAGRLDQWRFFASIAEQIRELRIAAPMVFILNPYYEAGLNEFGLMSEIKHELDLTQSSQSSQSMAAVVQRSAVSANSALKFVSTDFGEKKPQPWMERIGKKVGEWYASPALAYLWGYAERHPYKPRDWPVRVAAPSPVVIDFIAGNDLVQRKVSGGYVLSGNWSPAEWLGRSTSAFAPSRSGGGRIVLYNFSDLTVTGRLVMDAGPGAWGSSAPDEITLGPGERRELSVELAVQAKALDAAEYRVAFVPTDPAISRSVWATRLLPDGRGMVEKRVRDFDSTVEAAHGRRAALLKRPLATGESRLHGDGRWLVTDGVRVEESDGVWRFHIDWLPEEALRPAAVELPLPSGFTFEAGTWLTLERRKVEGVGRKTDDGLQKTEDGGRTGEREGRGVSLDRLKPRAGAAGDVVDVYFRTENGNLYQTWPRLPVRDEWDFYAGRSEDFTMGFYGRAELPWRFSDNKPASLVFFLRPAKLPAVFEVRGAQISRWERARSAAD